MKCIITGHTRGIGLKFYEYFDSIGWDVIGFSKTSGYNLIKDSDKIISLAEGCDLFINNSYADGIQIKFLNLLHNKVNKMIVCGSIAADGAGDPKLLEYSNHKKLLEYRFKEISSTKQSNCCDLLLLKLTSSSYSNPTQVINLIEYWLENPDLIIATFNVRNTI